MSTDNFTGHPAAPPRGWLHHPNFDELEDHAAPWDPLIQKTRVFRQRYGESNDEKRPHLEEHFSAANAGWYHQGNVRDRLPLEMVAEWS